MATGLPRENWLPKMNLPIIRLDRSLTTAIFHPLERAALAGRSLRLPILMYHSLSDNPENGVAAYYKTNTDPLVFRQQMHYLAAAGYKTLDLMQVVARLQNDRPFGEKTVVITFDDGFKDFYIHGFPILKEHGFDATVFLPTAFIAAARRSFKGTECLAWHEVRELRKAGITFGSHTVNHPELIELPFPEIERELRDSKIELEQQLGEPVTTFAYPYAFPQRNRRFAQAFKDLLVQSGYACCVTTELGRVKPGDDPYRLKRLPANSLDDPALFRAKLEGGYDWLAAPQALIKKFKCDMSVPKKRQSTAVPIERPTFN
jgi:peptidoglycan/xylan/chitin deacetylase (PgdA/CDA1 family)